MVKICENAYLYMLHFCMEIYNNNNDRIMKLMSLFYKKKKKIV